MNEQDDADDENQYNRAESSNFPAMQGHGQYSTPTGAGCSSSSWKVDCRKQARTPKHQSHKRDRQLLLTGDYTH